MKYIFTIIVVAFTAFGSIAQVEKTLLVEHFTNTRCSTCASRNPELFSLLDNYPQVLHIAYHPSSPYSSCAFSMHNPVENDARTNFYNIYGGTPRVVLSGEVIGFQNPILNADQIEAALGQQSDFSVMATQTQTDNDEVQVQTIIKRVSGSGTEKILLFAMIAEKEVNYAAPNGENLHHNVFRKQLLDEDFILNNAGDSLIFNESYNINSAWEADELFITVVLQNETSIDEIYQSYASATLDAGSSFIGDKEILSIDGMLYPNPANDVIHLSEDQQNNFIRAEFYAMTGNLVKSFDQPASMNISELPEGIYMAVLIDERNKQHVTRIVKQ